EWHGERGRVDDLIRKYVHLWGLTPEDTSAYLCGHPGMVESGRGILLRAGWSKQAIQDEVYFQAATECFACRACHSSTRAVLDASSSRSATSISVSTGTCR